MNWSAVPGADIYQVEYYTDSSKAMKCVTTGTSITLKKLAKNEAYTVYITGGRKYADGTTVAWSDSSISKLGIPVKPSNVSGVEVNYYWQNLSEISVRNSTIECADGYQYQLYTAYKDKDSKIKTVTTSSTYPQTYIKTSALKKHNFYKVRVRAYALNSKNEKMFQTTTKTGTVITKCGKSKLKSGKTYYFYIAPQKKVGNKYVSGLAGNANYCWKLKYKK